jgi:outer membrane protein assembly factor BamB
MVLMAVTPPAPSDWPQFGGPARNFVVTATVSNAFPETGPKVVWKRELGEGYSGITVVGGMAYTMYKRGTDDVTVALDARTGKTLWAHATDRMTPRRLDLQFGQGPHSTPLVTGGRVLAINTAARLVALDAKTGKMAWTRDLWKEFNGAELGRGYAASPIAWKDTIILPLGGEGHSLIAFRQADGSVAWQRDNFEGTYSSPQLIEVGGLAQIVVFLGGVVAGFNPDNGDLQWKHPHPAEWNLNISTPVWGSDNVLFISSAYGGGSNALQLTREGNKTKVKELWENKRMRIHHSNAIRLGDYVYGSSGDFGPAPLTCVNVKDGKIAWQDRTFAKATLVWTGDKMIVLDEGGDLAIAEVSPQGLKVLARHALLTSNSWTPPSLAGGILYARDRKEIVAVDLR